MAQRPLDPLEGKHRVLAGILRGLGRVLVAYSGGADSTLLLRVAADTLPPGDVLAVTAVSPVLPQTEKDDAVRLARRIGIRHLLRESAEMDDPDFTRNPENKCYVCKRGRYARLLAMAVELGFGHVLDGENSDDAADFRPGARAARELGIRSPLAEAGFSKAEIRLLSQRLGLPTWDKASSACLASRIAYHSPITVEKLAQVEAGEEFLRGLGISGQVRVRHHGDIARLEVAPEAIPRLMAEAMRRHIVSHFKSFGFLFVALDLEGYRTGSLNRAVVDGG